MVQPINVRAINQGLRRWPINSTTNLGAGGAVDAYLVNSLSPDTVADFAGVLNSGAEYYRVGGTETTFASMFTHARASNAPMTDSSGNLVWAPHNLLTYSEQFDNAAWSKFNISVSADATTAPDGTTTADKLVEDSATGIHLVRQAPTTTADVSHGFAVFAKAAERSWIVVYPETSGGAGAGVWFDLANGLVGTEGAGRTGAITSVGDGWYLCVVTATLNTAGHRLYLGPASADNTLSYAGDGSSGVYVWGAHLYRSDLGGMVNNPDRGDSYVPTTSAARYLPRRNHYRYNGSSYVKKGILLESAAATNLVLTSNATRSATNGTSQAAGAQTTPSGNTDGFEFFPNTSTADHYIDIGGATEIAFDGSSRYAHSIYVKARGSQRYISIGFDITAFGVANRFAGFDLVAGTVTGAQTNCAGYIEALDGGWYRCTVTAPSVSAASKRGGYVVLRNTSGLGTESYAGNTADGIYYYGSQVELSSVPTSYIPTSGATATRAAETKTAAGSDLDASTTAMSFHLAGEENYADLATAGQVELFDWRVDANNRITITIDTDGAKTGTITLTMVNGGSSASVAATTQLTPGLHKAFNIAWRVTGSEINIALNGTAATATATAIGVPDLSSAAAAFEGRGTRSIFRQAAADWTDAGIESASS